VLVLLVGTVFLVQNNFYSHISLRTQVQENARAMKEMVGGEVRAMTAGGLVIADSTRLVVRANMIMAVVCGRLGTDVIVHLPGGTSAVDTADVAGFGYRNATTGAWEYHDRAWSTMVGVVPGVPALVCYQNGADTTGISSEFVRVQNIDNDTHLTTTALYGSVLMFYRKSEFRFDNSALITGDRALYWGLYGQTLKELLTGMGTNAHFEYRTGTNTWSKAPATLASVNGVRIVAESIGKGRTSAELNYTFDLTLDVPLANAY
jgi:hypothetical protein